MWYAHGELRTPLVNQIPISFGVALPNPECERASFLPVLEERPGGGRHLKRQNCWLPEHDAVHDTGCRCW